MNLNNLKPAWRQFFLYNSMQPIDQNEILLIIEHTDGKNKKSVPSLMVNAIMFTVLVICCQGGCLLL